MFTKHFSRNSNQTHLERAETREMAGKLGRIEVGRVIRRVKRLCKRTQIKAAWLRG